MVGYIFVYGIVGAIVSVLTFSFNPYITNTIDHQTPFYPLMGGIVMLILCLLLSLSHLNIIIA